jgi:hypothetical protein
VVTLVPPVQAGEFAVTGEVRDVGERLAGIVGHVQVVAQRIAAKLTPDARLNVFAA